MSSKTKDPKARVLEVDEIAPKYEVKDVVLKLPQEAIQHKKQKQFKSVYGNAIKEVYVEPVDFDRE